MKKIFLFLAILAFLVPAAMAAFDKTGTDRCRFVVVCPDGTEIGVTSVFFICINGWGFCFSDDVCGEGITLASICGGHGTGGGSGGICELDPFHCNPFAT